MDAEQTPGDGAAPGLGEDAENAAQVHDAGAGASGPSSKPRRGDKAPRKRAKKQRKSEPAPEPAGAAPKGAALKAQSARLERSLGEILAFPAVPAMMVAPDEETRAYLPEHFTRMAPITAHELVAASESSPELRRVLERAAYGSSMFTVAFAALAYAAPPVMWVIGMRAQAAQLTLMASMDESQMAAGMMAARAAAEAQSAPPPPEPQGAEWNGAAGAEAPAPGADPLHG